MPSGSEIMNAVEKVEALQKNIEQALVGKPEVVRHCIVALLARGHLLIEDVPGVGKTTLAQALARSVGGIFQRIQFTSDLLPSDIIGVSVYDPGKGNFEFKAGPIFANVILADEINRTTPKTQSSLLEAMNEFQVSLDHNTYRLPRPFIVLATQNPLEYQGTHPLPESQLDRFLMRIRIGYPPKADEKRILRGAAAAATLEGLRPVISSEEVLALQEAVERVRVDDALADYVLAIAEATRKADILALGVSPRGSLALYRAAQGSALAAGRTFCIPDDFKEMAIPVLSHRIILKAHWEQGMTEGEGAEAALQAILEQVPVPD